MTARRPLQNRFRNSLLALLILPSLLVAAAAPATAQVHSWSQAFGGVSNEGVSSPWLDEQGNVFITGSFASNFDLGGGTLILAGGLDAYVAKYDINGVHQWSRAFSGVSTDQGKAVVADGAGNVLVTGSFSSAVDFGGGALTSAGGSDIYLAKFDATGAHLWSQRFGDTSSDQGLAVATDGAGNVFVTGDFRGTVDFGGGPLVAIGSSDMFVAKFDGNGAHIWSQRFGTGGTFGKSVTVDGAGNVVTTAAFQGTADFGGGPLISAGSNDIAIAKYDANGVHIWSQRFGSTGFDSPIGLAIDDADNIMVTGSFSDTVDFGGGGLISAGFWDIFVTKYQANGVHVWSRRFGSSGFDNGVAVSTDFSGNVYVTGHFTNTVDFGGGALTSAGNNDVFVAKYDANAVHIFSQRFGGSGADTGGGIGVDGSESFVLAGSFQNTVDFGGGGLTSAGLDDIYLARYNATAAGAEITSIDDVSNDQGRFVRITFDGSNRDFVGSPTPVFGYDAFRRIDALPLLTAESGANRIDGWEFVGSIPANGELLYNMIAPTLADSTVSSGIHYSVYFVRAQTASPLTFFDSAADSGYSLDNLAPGVPQALVFAFPGILNWTHVPAADFDFYTIYGSSSSTFDATAVSIGFSVAPTFDVQSSPQSFYFVSVTDFAGNESDKASVDNPTAIPETPLVEKTSLALYPNPFNPVTTIVYRVSVAGPVSVRLYDAAGKLVEALVDNEDLEPNEYRIQYRPRVASGVYFLRLETAGQVRSTKLVLTK